MSENDDYLSFVYSQNSKYQIQILSEESKDFKLIKKSFHNTSGDLRSDLKIKRICRVHQRQPNKTLEDIDSDKTLVVHGTPRRKVPGILQKGFISSVKGFFGPGVYHSNYFSKCMGYASRGSEDGSYFFFVNEIPYKYITEKNEYDCNEVLPEFYCHKYLSIPNLNEQHEPDSDGSLINTTTDVQIGAMYPNKNDYQYMPEYVASRNIVVPKYLVHATRKMEKLV